MIGLCTGFFFIINGTDLTYESLRMNIIVPNHPYLKNFLEKTLYLNYYFFFSYKCFKDFLKIELSILT